MPRAAASKKPAFQLAEIDGSRHERLTESLEQAIRTGTFKPGERLPTHRELSQRFGVAIGTVTKAIDTLTRRGLVRGEVGRGTFVLRPEIVPAPAPGPVDLSINTIPLPIDVEILVRAGERAARKLVDLPNGGYWDISGLPAQRASLAGWLTRTRVQVEPDAIVATVGAQHAIGLAFADIATQGEAIATEPATFTGAIAAARELNLDLLPVAIDEQGMVPSELDGVLKSGKVRAIYTTPVAQNPVGFETSDDRKREIVDICRKRRVYIVEDEVYAAFRTSDTVTYKSLAPELVYYVSSLSKCLSPLLRVGVLAPPPGRRAPVLEYMRGELWAAPPLAVATACELIDTEADVPAAAWLRAEAAARNEMAAALLGRDFVPEGSLRPHLWIPMPLHLAEKVARRAIERGIRVTPPGAPVLEGARQSGLRLCLLAPPDRERLERGLRSLSGILSEPDEPIV